jgi:hypothetical protein
MGTISGCRYLKVNLKAKIYFYVSLLSKGVPTKLLKFFWLKIFFICHRCQRHRWSILSCEYLREFSKKFETVLIGHSGVGGKLIHKKNSSKKSCDTVPLSFIYKSLSYFISGKQFPPVLSRNSPCALSKVGTWAPESEKKRGTEVGVLVRKLSQLSPQCKEVTSRPPELVQHFRL